MQATLPAHLSPVVQAALAEAREALHDLYGARLLRLVLYGSHTRGEAHEESDVDVLVVLDGEVDFMAEVHRMLDVDMAILDTYHLILSLLPVAAETFEQPHHPLMINVRREGVVV